MLNCGLSLDCGESDLPHTKVVFLHGVRQTVPVVYLIGRSAFPSSGGVSGTAPLTEISEEMGGYSIRRPLAVCNVIVGRNGDTELLVALYNG